MPTIKRKVEMNLPQLIEWLFRKRNLDDEIFLSDKHNSVNVTDDGILEFSGTFYNDTFTVEFEEEITEDTKINKLLVKFKSPSRYQMFCSDCINGFEIEEGNIEAFYVLNDDLTLTLIWTKEEGLVE